VIDHHLVAMDSPDALRQRLFGRRIRIDVSGGSTGEYARAAQAAGARSLVVEEGSLVLEAASDAEVAGIVRALVNAGADIFAVVPDEVRLEDVYLRLVD
jgi:ABC-2 type transport system ATP-binding protein